MRKSLIVVITICLLGSIHFVKAEKIDFWIIHSKDTVGVLNVERKSSSSHTVYKLYSKVDVTFIFHLLIVNNMAIVYENGKLINADVMQTSNRGVFDANIKAKFDSDKYLVTKNGSNYQLSEKEIHWSVARMYFEEPVGVKSVYAEDNGKMVKLEPKGRNKYSLDVAFPSIFTYRNGSLWQMKAETIVGPIYFIKK